MLKRLSIIAFAAPALLASGCATTSTENRGLESVHQPVVSRTDYIFDMNTDNGRPAAGEVERLGGWLASLRLGYGDRVGFDDPSGINSAARADVNAAVGRYGLILADSVPISASQPAPGTVRVIISRTAAAVPTCPDNRETGNFNFTAHTSSNHGCAINSNLAAMIAQPEDLVRGQRGSPTSDPATAGHAIDLLRKVSGSGGAPSSSGSAAGGGAATGGSSTGGGGH